MLIQCFCCNKDVVSLSFSMGGVALVSVSSMDNPEDSGAIGNHGDELSVGL